MTPTTFKPTKFPKPLEGVIQHAKKVASKYYKETGRPLGITGEIAEFEAIKNLKLAQSDARQKGYDALMKKANKIYKIQIKGKVIQPGKKNGARMGAIQKDSEWDYVILVILDLNYEPQAMYRADKKKIKEALEVKGSKNRDRGALSIREFISLSKKPIWPKN